MKTAFALGAISALLSVSAFGQGVANHGDPFTPVGWLDIEKVHVRTGVKPQLTWKITYPKTVHDIVDIDPETDKIIPKVRTRVEIRVVGVAFQSGSTHLPASLQVRVGSGSSWTPVFYGRGSDVNPTDIVYSGIVDAGTTIDFAAQGQRRDGGWYSSRNTLAPTQTVQALTKGDSVPYYVPAYDQGTVESFLTSYIDEDNFVTIGPRDVIFLTELYSTDPTSRYFDMQDIVAVATFLDVTE